MEMFTGIIIKVGKIKKIENKRSKTYFTIEAKDFLKNVKVGDSISCDGACLTVIKKDKDKFRVELMRETLKVTKFNGARVGNSVNLELALRVGDRLDGHFVMGHVDGVGMVEEFVGNDLIVKAPQKLTKYLVCKGSATINGVSLTVAGIVKNKLRISLIEHTLKNTNLSLLKKGDKVNIEIDMMARYLEKLLKNN